MSRRSQVARSNRILATQHRFRFLRVSQLGQFATTSYSGFALPSSIDRRNRRGGSAMAPGDHRTAGLPTNLAWIGRTVPEHTQAAGGSGTDHREIRNRSTGLDLESHLARPPLDGSARFSIGPANVRSRRRKLAPRSRSLDRPQPCAFAGRQKLGCSGNGASKSLGIRSRERTTENKVNSVYARIINDFDGKPKRHYRCHKTACVGTLSTKEPYG